MTYDNWHSPETLSGLPVTWNLNLTSPHFLPKGVLTMGRLAVIVEVA